MYPNAYNGIKKIYTAEILSVITSVIAIIASISLIVGLNGADKGDITDGIAAAFVGGGALLIISAIIAIVAFILNVVGISKASTDEPIFKKAMMWLIISIVGSIVSGFFQEGSALQLIFNLVYQVGNILVTLFVIDGITSLGSKLGKTSLVNKGKSLKSMILVFYVISLILTIIEGFLTNNDTTVVIGGVHGIIALIVLIIAFFMYLSLLSKAKKALAQ